MAEGGVPGPDGRGDGGVREAPRAVRPPALVAREDAVRGCRRRPPDAADGVAERRDRDREPPARGPPVPRRDRGRPDPGVAAPRAGRGAVPLEAPPAEAVLRA